MFDTPLLTGNMYRETSLYVLASSVTHGNETMNLESVVALVWLYESFVVVPRVGLILSLQIL